MSAGSIVLLLDSSGIGGIERHVSILCRALNHRGRPARIALLDDHGEHDFLRLLRSEKLPFEILEGGFRGVWRMLRQAQPSLLHTHGYKADLFGRIAALATGVPCVSTFHAGERAPWPVGLYQRLDELSAPLATCISVNNAIARSLPTPSTVVANFIATPDVPPRGPLPRSVSFVGRLSHEKGPDLFCEIARQRQGAASFHMWGDGPMRARLETEYGDCVTFHGTTLDVASVWRNTGLLLAPSRAEGLPMAALEALAEGVPVAAARVGALPALIADGVNGWTFESGDLSAASRAIDLWLAALDGGSDTLRETCWRRVRDAYGLDKGVSETLRVYERAGLSGATSARTVQSSFG